MYSPKHFEETRREVMQALVKSQPLSTLAGHVARANPLWRTTRFDTPVLAIFQGPQHHISPGWYPAKQEHGKVVPTWNYAVVQASGVLRVHDDPDRVRAQVSQITGQQEAGFEKPWAVDDAPRDYTDSMIKAIVGISIEVTHWTGKWKVSHNQVPVNRAGVVAALASKPQTDAAAMAELVAAFAPGESKKEA